MRIHIPVGISAKKYDTCFSRRTWRNGLQIWSKSVFAEVRSMSRVHKWREGEVISSEDEIRLDFVTEKVPGAWNSSPFLYDPRALIVIGDLLYICDCDHDRIIATNVYTLEEPFVVAGTGIRGRGSDVISFEGPALSTSTSQPLSLFPAPDGSFYFTCFMYQALWRYKDGYIKLVAGNLREKGDTGDTLENVLFSTPHSGCVDSVTGKVYLAEGGNHIVRVISGNEVKKIGKGQPGFADGSFSECAFKRPYALTRNATNGRIFLAEYSAVREIHTDRECVTTWCGNTETAGFRDGPKDVARFQFIRNLEVSDDDYIVLADEDNRRVRMIDQNGFVRTIAGQYKSFPCSGIAISPSGDVFVSISGANVLHVIRSVIPTSKLDAFSMRYLDSMDQKDVSKSDITKPLDSGLGVDLIYQTLQEYVYPFIRESKSFAKEFSEHCAKGNATLEDLKAYLYDSAIPTSLNATATLMHLIHKHNKTNKRLVAQLARPFFKRLLHPEVSESTLLSLVAFAANQLDSSSLLLPRFVSTLKSRFPRANIPLSANGVEIVLAEAQIHPLESYKHEPTSYLCSKMTLLFKSTVFPHFNRTLGETTNLTGLPLPNFAISCCTDEAVEKRLEGGNIMCHDWVLYARWPYFRHLMQSQCMESETKMLLLPDQSLSLDSIKALVQYLYTNTIPISLSLSNAKELLENAPLFNLSSITDPTKPSEGFETLFLLLNNIVCPPQAYTPISSSIFAEEQDTNDNDPEYGY